MGLGGISPWSLLLILVIILLLFGTKRLRNMGGDLGGAFKSFKKSMRDEEATPAKKEEPAQVTQQDTNGRVIDSEAKEKEKV